MEEEKPPELIPTEEKSPPKYNRGMLVTVFIILLAIVSVMAYISQYYIPISKMAGIKNESFQNGTILGYNQCLLEVAYTVVTKGGASYIVPTTNQTITLVQQVKGGENNG